MAYVDVPTEFLSFLQREQENARDTGLEDARAVAIEFYQGLPFGDEVEGRSAAVTRDVSEVTDFLTVGILGTIISSGKVVEFESEQEPVEPDNDVQQAPQPQQQPMQGLPGGQPMQQPQPGQQVMGGNGGPQMVDYGEQATASIQYQFLRKQKGYRILHDILKAGLLEKSGIVKTYIEPQPPIPQQHRVTVDEIEGDENDETGRTYQGSPIVQAQPADDDWQPGMPSALWDVTIHKDAAPKFCDIPVPNEYFRVAPDAIDLDEAVYVGECTPKTMSDLVKLGYDPADLEPIWGNAPAETIVSQARDSERSKDIKSVGQRPGVDKMLWLTEEYPLWDFDGDGIAERLFVHRIGAFVLKVMPVDEQPYSLWSPFPMQHRLIGQSVADKTMDIQRIRSVLLRQGLDSQYLSNSPRTLVDETSMTVDTIDDLLTVRPGGLIRYRGNAPQPFQQQDTSAVAFQGMEMMSTERESRVGVTRQSQGMNPDTMNTTASGLAMNIQSAQQIELYICRNFVELAVAPMFAKRYRLMRRYGRPFRMKIQGKYTTVDPRAWPDEIDMSINVGLGTGNKDQKLQYRMQLLTIQSQAIAAGMQIVQPEQIYQNVKGMIEDSGLGTPSDYILDPSTLPPSQPKPDPEMAKAMADSQTQQQQDAQAHEQAMTKLQMQQQDQQAQAAIKAEAAQQDLMTKRASAEQAANLAEARAAHEADLANAKAAKEAELAQNRQIFEMDLAERRFAFDQEMAKKKHEQAAQNDDNIAGNRPGGSLAE